MTITAAVDGSALGNPGPAGWAWIVSETCWDAGGWAHGTNNLGELTAVLELLRATREAGRAHEPLKVLADSQYAINVVTKWRHGWKKRGWQKADKKPIANLEVIQALDEEMSGRDVTFEWVRGHAGHAMNELADDRARSAAEAYQAGRVPAPGPGFGGEGDARDGSREESVNEAGASGLPVTVDARTTGSHSVDAEGAPGASEGLVEDEGTARVVPAEKDFIRAWVMGDGEALAALSGPRARRVWTDGSVREGLAGPAPAAPRIGRIDVVSAAEDAWIASYRMRWQGGESIETSVWSSAKPSDDGRASGGRGLVLVWHQSTLAS